MKDLKKYLLKGFYGEDVLLVPFTHKYRNNQALAIEVYDDEDKSEFACLTVNLSEGMADDQLTYLDTNNNPWVEEFVKKHKLGEDTGIKGYSGFCVYPLFAIHPEMLNPEELEEEYLNGSI